MQADNTRDTFQKDKHIRQTLMQQGRVQIEADWNEQAAITTRRDESAVADLAGNCGGPADSAAFGVLTEVQAIALGLPPAPAGDFYLSVGRYYVDGIQCELEKPVLYSKQPDRVGIEALAAGSHLLYLDVWPRHLTALDDPTLLDPALGGVDTATRVKTVWQVRALELGAIPDEKCGAEIDTYNERTAPSEVRLSVRTKIVPGTDDPCQVPETSGYKGLENQLYRVEIHRGRPDAGGDPAWKWSRENGSVVTAITGKPGGPFITVASTGRDEVLGFKDGDIVELLDDRLELEKGAGLIAAIDGAPVDGNVKLKAHGGPLPVLAEINLALHPKLRRWEGFHPLDDAPIQLEAGVEVTFHDHTERCRAGDYWQIPARTATATARAGDIEWPRELDAVTQQPDPTKPLALLPRGVEHHYCRIGFFVTNLPAGEEKYTDCRCLWPALTSVPRLFYVSGDGQETMPDLTAAAGQLFPLPRPFIVGVANPHCLARPLKVKVRFIVVNDPPDRLSDGKVAARGDAPVATHVDVPLDANGLAYCEFHLDPVHATQQVKACLLDDEGREVSLPLFFNANLSLASQVAYQSGDCSTLQDANTVQQALDLLCEAIHHGCEWTVGKGGDFPDLETAFQKLTERELKDWRLCLLAGEHKMVGLKLPNLRLQLTGSHAAVLVVGGKTVFANLRSLVVRDLSAVLPEDDSVLVCHGCEDVELSNCRIEASDAELGALQLLHDEGEPRRIRLTANQIQVKPNNALALLIESERADCWMEGNEVKGWISVDGPLASVTDRKNLVDWAFSPNPNPLLKIEPSGGAWHLRRNHLDGVTIGNPIVRKLLPLTQGRDTELAAGFDEIFAEGNRISQSMNLLFARNVHLHATSFASSPRPACVVFASSGIFVGNQGSARNVVLAKVVSGANHFSEAANLITITRV